MENPNCSMITIQLGDTLALLAKNHETTVDAILQSNPSLDPANLQAGQIICIPNFPPLCPIGSIPYEIKAGENLETIAAKYYTTSEAILLTNPTIDENNLQIGQTICIKQIKPEVPNCPSMNIYVINPQDTFYSIAKKFGTTVNDLVTINPSIDYNQLQIGEIICLPLTPTPYIIVVDTAKKLLTLYFQGRLAQTYPVAVGKPTTPSPIGNFYILNKQVNPGGPFGSRWMGLSQPHYGIHGTNRPESIGTAASNGCIRMHNKDVEDLFSKVSVQTPVILIH